MNAEDRLKQIGGDAINKIYAHHCIKYDPSAASRVIMEALRQAYREGRQDCLKLTTKEQSE